MTTQVAIRMNDQQLGDLDWIVVRCDFENRAEASSWDRLDDEDWSDWP